MTTNLQHSCKENKITTTTTTTTTTVNAYMESQNDYKDAQIITKRQKTTTKRHNYYRVTK